MAAQVIVTWSHRGRVRSEAAFARLAGVAAALRSTPLLRVASEGARPAFVAVPAFDGYYDTKALGRPLSLERLAAIMARAEPG